MVKVEQDYIQLIHVKTKMLRVQYPIPENTIPSDHNTVIGIVSGPL